METINRQYKNHKGFANNIIKTTLLKQIAVYIKNAITHPRTLNQLQQKKNKTPSKQIIWILMIN